MENNKQPSSRTALSQISFLIQILRNDEYVNKFFNIDYESAFSKLRRASPGQVKLFHALMINKKYEQLNNLLNNFGFKQII
jgi:hypothetical protein